MLKSFTKYVCVRGSVCVTTLGLSKCSDTQLDGERLIIKRKKNLPLFSFHSGDFSTSVLRQTNIGEDGLTHKNET